MKAVVVTAEKSVDVLITSKYFVSNADPCTIFFSLSFLLNFYTHVFLICLFFHFWLVTSTHVVTVCLEKQVLLGANWEPNIQFPNTLIFGFKQFEIRWRILHGKTPLEVKLELQLFIFSTEVFTVTSGFSEQTWRHDKLKVLYVYWCYYVSDRWKWLHLKHYYNYKCIKNMICHSFISKTSCSLVSYFGRIKPLGTCS